MGALVRYSDQLSIGHYRVVQRLGAGGMGEVFLAVDRRTRGRDRCVVVKRILPAFAQDPEFRLMFLNEVRLASCLAHANIARVLDCGIADGDYFMVVEYVHGETLARVLGRLGAEHRVPIESAASVVLGVAAGLYHAHERVDEHGNKLGLVHRDVSPANVLIGYDGSVKIIDFGIATAAAATRVTRAGTIKGKAAYMSPEMCRGERVDVTSDIYGLGILLYEATTSRRLFHGENELAIMNQVARGRFIPPTRHFGDYPQELEDIVMCALDPVPSRRFQSAEQLRSALQGYCLRAGLDPSSRRLAGMMVEAFGDKPYPTYDPRQRLGVLSGGERPRKRKTSRGMLVTAAIAATMGGRRVCRRSQQRRPGARATAPRHGADRGAHGRGGGDPHRAIIASLCAPGRNDAADGTDSVAGGNEYAAERTSGVAGWIDRVVG